MMKMFKDGNRLVIIIENVEMSEDETLKKFIASITKETNAEELSAAEAAPVEPTENNEMLIAEEMEKVDALLSSIKSMKDETNVLNELRSMADAAEAEIKKSYIESAIKDYLVIRMKQFDESYVNGLDEKQAKSFINHYGRFADNEFMKSVTMDKAGVLSIINYFK